MTMSTTDYQADRIDTFKSAASEFERTYQELRTLVAKILGGAVPAGASPGEARTFAQQIENAGSALEQLAEAYGDFVEGEPDEPDDEQGAEHS
jgi:hypothetical protein